MTTVGQLGTLGERVLDVLVGLLDCGLVDHRANHRAFGQTMADGHFADALDEPCEEVVVDAPLHVRTVGADTGLAGITDFAGQRTLDRRIEIRIIEESTQTERPS